jgi:rhamnose utilization protein RhaD (predicted bifunctional aldolase and dehydrogenase)
VSLDRLVELSRYYGTTAGYVLGGGGNTSYKNAETLWVKASGSALATISVEGFVTLDRSAVRSALTRRYPSVAKEREALVLSALLESRRTSGRPSVETFLHELMDFPYVVHTHPTAVNVLTCALSGRQVSETLFPDAVWVEYTDPGYLLSIKVAQLLDDYREAHGKLPQILLLENHGLVVGGSTPEEIASIHKSLFAALPQTPSVSATDRPLGGEIKPIEALLKEAVAPHEALFFEWSRTDVRPELMRSAFTPDHIVYMGVRPLFAESLSELTAEVERYQTEFRRAPKAAVMSGLGTVSFAPTATGASLAMALFQDAAAIAAGSTLFGGPRYMTPAAIEFILNWEAERYRSQTSGAG